MSTVKLTHNCEANAIWLYQLRPQWLKPKFCFYIDSNKHSAGRVLQTDSLNCQYSHQTIKLMSKDRLGEVSQKYIRLDEGECEENTRLAGSQEEVPLAQLNLHSTYFNSSIGDLSNSLDLADSLISEASTLYNHLLVCVNPSEITSTNNHLSDLILKTNGILDSIASTLKTLNATTRTMTGSTRQSRITQQTSIAKRLMDTITRFKKLQITSKAQSDERLAREIRHACPDMLESDVKAIVENSNQSASLSNKLLNPRIDNQRLVLESARDRTKQMEQLDQSITQLASMFIMMQEFLEKQQETIDFVESNVENAVVDVEVGSQMMTEAIKIRSETRSRSRIILSALCYLILLIIIVTAVIAFQ